MTFASEPAFAEEGPAVDPVSARLHEIMTRWECRVDTALLQSRGQEGITTRSRAQKQNHLSEEFRNNDITDWDEPGEIGDDDTELDY